MKKKDITKDTDSGLPDDESLPLTKCKCGQEWDLWGGPILAFDYPTECPNCKRQLVWGITIKIYEVEEE